MNFANAVGFAESSVIWLLIGVPLIASLWPGDRRARIRRAAVGFVCVILFGIAVSICKLFVSADLVHREAETSRNERSPKTRQTGSSMPPVGK